MTGRHQGLKLKHTFVFIVKCGIRCFLCTMQVFEVQASSSATRLSLVIFCFFCSLHCWASPCRIIVYSITHSRSLFDVPGTETPTLQNKRHRQQTSYITRCVNDRCLCSLTIEINHTIDTGRNVTGCQTLVDAIHKEMQSTVVISNYSNSVTCLQHRAVSHRHLTL